MAIFKSIGLVEVLIGAAVVCISVTMFVTRGESRDYTKRLNEPDHTGIRVKFDTKTGCQYLFYNGGLVSRLDSEGKHIGCKP